MFIFCLFLSWRLLYGEHFLIEILTLLLTSEVSSHMGSSSGNTFSDAVKKASNEAQIKDKIKVEGVIYVFIVCLLQTSQEKFS